MYLVFFGQDIQGLPCLSFVLDTSHPTKARAYHRRASQVWITPSWSGTVMVRRRPFRDLLGRCAARMCIPKSNVFIYLYGTPFFFHIWYANFTAPGNYLELSWTTSSILLNLSASAGSFVDFLMTPPVTHIYIYIDIDTYIHINYIYIQ